MIFKKINIIFVALSLFVPIGGLSQQGQDFTYLIGAKDQIKISVFGVPELNTTVRVSEDGTVTLPLLGNIKVERLNRFQLEKKLKELLELKYLRNPQVTVSIEDYQSKQVSVIGAVRTPGNYNLVGKKTLLELISTAGGLTNDASERIVVIRQYKNGASSSLQIDLQELMIEGNPKLNIPLQAGDIINIALERHIDVYVLGQVRQPGLVKVKRSGPATLLKAIALAGGFGERARKSAVMVTRLVNGKEKKIRINVNKILSGKIADFVLKNSDIIHVPQSIL